MGETKGREVTKSCRVNLTDIAKPSGCSMGQWRRRGIDAGILSQRRYQIGLGWITGPIEEQKVHEVARLGTRQRQVSLWTRRSSSDSTSAPSIGGGVGSRSGAASNTTAGRKASPRCLTAFNAKGEHGPPCFAGT